MIAAALDEILSLGIELELADNSLDNVGFIVADLLIEVQAADCSVLKLNVELLLADLHWLIAKLRA